MFFFGIVTCLDQTPPMEMRRFEQSNKGMHPSNKSTSQRIVPAHADTIDEHFRCRVQICSNQVAEANQQVPSGSNL